MYKCSLRSLSCGGEALGSRSSSTAAETLLGWLTLLVARAPRQLDWR
jgi:hypothetical protein